MFCTSYTLLVKMLTLAYTAPLGRDASMNQVPDVEIHVNCFKFKSLFQK